MSTGRKTPVKGFKLDKSGRTLKRDIRQYDASKQAKLKGGKQKVRYGRKGGKR